MTWWAYVQRVAPGQPNARIAKETGIAPSSVGRWGKGSGPDPEAAANFARAYDRPVLEAFIAAGFLTAAEAGEKPSAAPSLASLSADDLLKEVRRRMEGGQSWGEVESGSEEPPPGVTPMRPRKPRPPVEPERQAADDPKHDATHEGGNLDGL